ncbi:HAUS augmin-like complex subunit 4 isoform X2 [Halichondria panicea]
MAAARLQHCLGSDEPLLGVTTEHLRAVDPMRGIQKCKKEVMADLEVSLRSKVARVLSWQSPQRELGDNESIRLAKIGQLPQLLRQQVDENRRNKEEIEVTRKEIVETLKRKHKVFVEMCAELRGVLEGLKLGVVMEADQAAMEHTASQCTAMSGKLEVMYYQLLKGVCSEGRLQALKEIQSHLEAARTKLDERLIQSRQMLGHYHSLGEAFTTLAEQYHEMLANIENKTWALKELSKTTS